MPFSIKTIKYNERKRFSRQYRVPDLDSKANENVKIEEKSVVDPVAANKIECSGGPSVESDNSNNG